MIGFCPEAVAPASGVRPPSSCAPPPGSCAPVDVWGPRRDGGGRRKLPARRHGAVDRGRGPTFTPRGPCLRSALPEVPTRPPVVPQGTARSPLLAPHPSQPSARGWAPGSVAAVTASLSPSSPRCTGRAHKTESCSRLRPGHLGAQGAPSSLRPVWEQVGLGASCCSGAESVTFQTSATESPAVGVSDSTSVVGVNRPEGLGSCRARGPSLVTPPAPRETRGTEPRRSQREGREVPAPGRGPPPGSCGKPASRGEAACTPVLQAGGQQAAAAPHALPPGPRRRRHGSWFGSGHVTQRPSRVAAVQGDMSIVGPFAERNGGPLCPAWSEAGQQESRQRSSTFLAPGSARPGCEFCSAWGCHRELFPWSTGRRP